MMSDTNLTPLTSGWAQGMPHHARVAVILLTYGDYAEKYLDACYRSLRGQTYPADLFRVFIVMNGATAEGRAVVTRLAPGARVLENRANLGWSGGNNLALTVALGEDFEYLVMLNIDTVVDRHWLNTLVEAADSLQDTHILQSKILLDGTGQINSCGNRIHYLGYGYCMGYGDADSATPWDTAIDYASGAAMLVKRQVFERIGLFREDYFMYYDDMEFCWRARIAGFNVGLVEQSRCHHKYNFKGRLTMLYYLQRNRLLTLLTLERPATLAVTAPCLLVSELVVWGYFLIRGWGATTWDLLRYFLRPETWKMIRRRRREITSLRARDDREIVTQFAGTVAFAEVDSPVMRYIFNPLLGAYWIVAKRFIRW